MPPLADLQRVGIAVLGAQGSTVPLRDFVPIFHRWIQTAVLPDHLLIDIADYAHVPDGPGVLLVAHEANLGIELRSDRMLLRYTRKQPLPGALPERLWRVARAALYACRLLERDETPGGRLHFRGDQLEVFANDRLHAPNTAATAAGFRPALDGLLHALYGDPACQVTYPTDTRARFGVHIAAPRAAAFENLQAAGPLGLARVADR